MMHQDKDGHLVLSPKASFLMGLIGGVLVLCTIGFFITLSILLGGKGMKGDSLLGAAQPAPAAPTAPAPAAPTGGDERVVGTVAPVTDEDHVWGNANAKVTLIEWSDFECPFCGRFMETIDQVKAAYGKDEVRIVYRHFPLSFHPQARPAALASECAGEQGEFWEYHDLLFENSANLTTDLYEELAEDVGLNISQFNKCLGDQKYLGKVNDDMSAGSTAGITGTPGTIILGPDGSKQLIPGALPFEQVKPMIDAVL
jgi:protein-disulfide isomerase